MASDCCSSVSKFTAAFRSWTPWTSREATILQSDWFRSRSDPARPRNSRPPACSFLGLIKLNWKVLVPSRRTNRSKLRERKGRTKLYTRINIKQVVETDEAWALKRGKARETHTNWQKGCVNLISTIILPMISEKCTGGVIVAREVFCSTAMWKTSPLQIFVSYETRPILGMT